ncbi:helix-turn-helix domain-containing protein [Streptomyces sp. NPDC057621]|uniref:helix-turn-helix domain-containing protein n=1 Tax=Streptomyces sp. NPDC057621 TaxID=3346186 RepID=UPI0036825505
MHNGPGRPTTQPDPSKGAREQLAYDLLRLRLYRSWTLGDLAERSGLSKSTLSAATQGNDCPSWETMTRYLTACEEDPDAWRPRWEMTAEQHQRDHAGLPEAARQREAFRRTRPGEIRCLRTFAVALRQLKVWQGQPTYGRISRTAARAGFSVGQTTICNTFGGTKLPTENALLGVLAGMNLTKENPEVTEWLEARRRLEAAAVQKQISHPTDSDTGTDPEVAAEPAAPARRPKIQALNRWIPRQNRPPAGHLRLVQ